MTAVATPTQPRAKKTGTAKAAGHAIPTPSLTQVQTQQAFDALAKILADAHQTDEPHLWSGNSDRLLRVARDLAEEASKHPPSAADVDQLAFDIAALIVGAKLIPGDTESPERQALLQRAAVTLNWLTEEPGGADQDCCDPGADRPALRSDLHQRVAPKPTVVDGKTPVSEGGRSADRLAIWCVHDIATLACEVTVLGEECTANGETKTGAMLRCFGTRIEQLNSAVMSYLDGDAMYTMADMQRAHYGGAEVFTWQEHGNG